MGGRRAGAPISWPATCWHLPMSWCTTISTCLTQRSVLALLCTSWLHVLAFQALFLWSVELRLFCRIHCHIYAAYRLASFCSRLAHLVTHNDAQSMDTKVGSNAEQVSNMVSRELEKECIVVFDEAHNIDNVCIEVQHPRALCAP